MVIFMVKFFIFIFFYFLQRKLKPATNKIDRDKQRQFVDPS